MVLRPIGLSWIKGAADDPADLCAHGHVEFRVEEHVLIDPATGPEVTVSAAALYLLRTLSKAHTKAEPVGEQLFPCCGFAMYDIAGQDDVLVVGCPSGLDFEILHAENETVIVVRAGDGREFRVAWSAWVEAVYRFCDLVAEFYAKSSPKKPSADDVVGFTRFTAEWRRRRGTPLVAPPR
ncbi:MAG TPA: hypothetical protein VLT47_11665 [Anaeromyxobacteraceae bacterium]|nr:hypothetical protein [Anaeromyxobacteraceae bacterium]